MQIIAFAFGSACIGALIVTIIGGFFVQELRAEIERQRKRADVERSTANSYFNRYHALKSKQQPRDPVTGKMLPKKASKPVEVAPADRVMAA